MSETSAQNTDFRFNSQDFLGYQPSDLPIRPSLTMAAIVGTMWRLCCAHWLAIAVAYVFGCMLPTFIAEQVFKIKVSEWSYEVLRTDLVASLWTVLVSGWVQLAMAFLIQHVLSVELGRKVEWREILLKIVPILALTSFVFVGMIAGFILLVIPGVIFYLATMVALPILLMENKTIRESIQQSFDMTRGSRSKILWVSVGLSILSGVVVLAFGGLGQALGQVVGNAAAIDDYLGTFFAGTSAIPDALFASAIYLSVRKLMRVDEPDKLASVFD